MKLRTLLIAGCAAAFLTGCDGKTASFSIDGSNDVALTLDLNKDFFWSDWNLDLVVRNNPECQRRYALKPTGEDSPKVDLYSPETNVFILRQNKRWYVTAVGKCQFQAFKEPPPQPGTLIGTFKEKDGVFAFVKAP